MNEKKIIFGIFFISFVYVLVLKEMLRTGKTSLIYLLSVFVFIVLSLFVFFLVISFKMKSGSEESDKIKKFYTPEKNKTAPYTKDFGIFDIYPNKKEFIKEVRKKLENDYDLDSLSKSDFLSKSLDIANELENKNIIKKFSEPRKKELIYAIYTLYTKSKKELNTKKGFDLDNLPKSFSKEYKSFYIPKRDGSQRLIEAPNDELKETQRNILQSLQKDFKMPSYITAFKKKSGIKNNASKHVNKKIIINIDIENFFHSITSDKIRDSLKVYKIIKDEQIEKFIDIVTYQGRLSQGAPTSPFISNKVFLGIDNIIIKLLKKYDKNVSYTRYADDITFSSDNTKIKDAIRIISDSLLPKYGYKANKKKTTVYRSHTKQLVTGLVVNEKVSYPRNNYMKLRSMIYNFLKKSYGDPKIIKGHLSFLRSVDRKKYNKLKFYYRRNFKGNKNYEILF